MERLLEDIAENDVLKYNWGAKVISENVGNRKLYTSHMYCMHSPLEACLSQQLELHS
jgi:hypothetical protein